MSSVNVCDNGISFKMSLTPFSRDFVNTIKSVDIETVLYLIKLKLLIGNTTIN